MLYLGLAWLYGLFVESTVYSPLDSQVYGRPFGVLCKDNGLFWPVLSLAK